ncbi:MAG TPA: sugar ABC transporter substrate-binding protein [bacterium]
MKHVIFQILLSFLFLLMGCGSHAPNDKKVHIRLSSWGDAEEAAILTGLIGEFEKKNPGVVVELERTPVNEYVTKLLTEFAGHSAPDVVFTGAPLVTRFYAAEVLEPLNEYLKNDPEIKLTDFYSATVEGLTFNGKIMALPRDIACICVLYYNKDLFDKAGVLYPKDDWTWDQFLQTVKKLTVKNKDGKVSQWGFTDDWISPENWIFTAGGGWVDDWKTPNQFTLQNPRVVKGIQMRADLINRYRVSPAPSVLTAMGGMGTSDLFLGGKAALFLSGIWKTPAIRKAATFHWDCTMFPKNGKQRRWVSGAYAAYGILRASAHKPEAWKLVKFLSGKDAAVGFAQTGLAQPALKEVAESSAFLDTQPPLNKKMLLKAADSLIFEPRATNWSEIRDGLIGPELDRVWNGSESAQEAVDKLVEILKKHPLRTKTN